MKHFLLLLLLLSSSLSAQSYVGDKLLQKGDYPKAWTKIQKSLLKDSLDASAHYGAYAYYWMPSSPARDTLQAYRHVSLALHSYQHADLKSQARWDKTGLTSARIRSAAEGVCEALLQQALSQNTVEAMEHFLGAYPLSNDVQRRTATERMYSLAYSLACRTHTTSAYRNFISRYPQASQVSEAWRNIYDLEWLAVQQRGGKADYENYIQTYPQSPHCAEAQEMVDQYDYVQATSAHTWQQYADYILANPSKPKTLRLARQELYRLTRRSGSIRLMERTLGGNYLDSPWRDSLLLQLHAQLLNASLGNAADFHRRYTDACVAVFRQKDLDAAAAYEDLSTWDVDSVMSFVHKAAPYRAAYHQLQRLLAPYLSDREYDRALQVAQLFAADFGTDPDYLQLVQVLSDTLEGIEKQAYPTTINAPGEEQYSPVLSADDRTLYFCQQNYSEDIYESHYSRGAWSKGRAITDFSTDYNQEAPLAVSVDGTQLIFFRNGTICESDKTSSGWGSYEELPSSINMADWQSDVQITADGRALLFVAWKQGDYEPDEVSDFYADGDYRRCNIFVSLRDSLGQWGPAQDLGPTINTPWCDRSPYLHPDGKTLYFTSAGHGSLGDQDVFVCTRLRDDSWTEWSEPINLGKEINTPDQDWGYRITTDGTTAYFASNDDIMHCQVPSRLRPHLVACVSGRLTDRQGNPISADIRWEDLEQHQLVGQSHTDPVDGSYYMVLPLGRMYGYYVEDSSYFPISSSIDLRQQEKAVLVQQNLETVSFRQMVDEGVAVPMNNLFFDYASYELRPTSLTELQRVADIIRNNQLRVEISGHTDNQGSDEVNQPLSENRANAVRDYLIQLGIPAERLTAVGYGKQRPLVSNDTERGRQQNRRVELRFVK